MIPRTENRYGTHRRSLSRKRVYPVGRLDRNTTGLLLFTNDGDVARYLTHPSSHVKKIYSVELDKNLKVADMKQLLEGVELEDGISRVDDIAFDGDGSDKKVGRCRITLRKKPRSASFV